MNSQLEQQEMEKLASAASLVKELAEGHGIDIDNITEEEAESLLGMAYEALHGSEDDTNEEKTASVIVQELSQSEEGMNKLAAAGEIGEGLLQQEGISIDDLTEDQAAEVLLHVLNNYEFEDAAEEKTAAVIVDELSQTEEGLSKLAAAGEIAHEALNEEGLSVDDLSEEQAAELLLNIIIGAEENAEKTSAIAEDIEKVAALRQAGAIMYSGFSAALEKEAGAKTDAILALLAKGGEKVKGAGKWLVGRTKGGENAVAMARRGLNPEGGYLATGMNPLTKAQRRKRLLQILGGQVRRPIVPILGAPAAVGAAGGAGYLAGKKKK